MRIFYCDRLALTAGLRLWRLRRHGTGADRCVRVLDPLPTGMRRTLGLAWFRCLGFSVQEVPFFAGHLTMPDGRPVQVAAVGAAIPASIPEGQRITRDCAYLNDLNDRWGKDTVALHCVKSVSFSAGEGHSLYSYSLRLFAAYALAQRDGHHDAVVCLADPMAFSREGATELLPRQPVVFYGHRTARWRARVFLIRQFIRFTGRVVGAFVSGWSKRGTSEGLLQKAAERPGVLLAQEADISTDKSYRYQPHWLLPDDPIPDFNTFILGHTPPPRAPHDPVALATQRVWVLSDADTRHLGRPLGRGTAGSRLRRAAARTLWAGLQRTSAPEIFTLGVVARLFDTAAELANICERLCIRSFMTGENYLVPADAIQLVGSACPIHTISYQYSNIAAVSPVMLTTADTMLIASPHFEPFRRSGPFGSKDVMSIGYALDSSFSLVRGRAETRRRKLAANGARFIIGYFDETVQTEKYGLIGVDDHVHELRTLLEVMLADASLGFVVKTQYQRHSPSRFSQIAHLDRKARETGRYEEMLFGQHRNVILPAEAALVSDVTIGHAIGGTAPLEAAMAGARSLVLNPYFTSDGNQDIYRRADVLFTSLESALSAIGEFRAGRRPALGDWTPIASVFDPFRDGQSARRLRAVLDRSVTRPQ